MKTVLFVYCILLLRLILFRLILARPSVGESRPRIKQSSELHGRSFLGENNLRELISEMNTSRRNEGNIFVQDLNLSDRINKEDWIFRLNPELSNMTQSHESNVDIIYSGPRKQTIPTHRDSRISSHRFRHRLRSQNLNKVTTQFNLKNKVNNPPLVKKEPKIMYPANQFSEELPDMNVQSPLTFRLGFLNKRESGHIIRSRTRRSGKETSQGFKHVPSRQIPPEYMILLFRLLSGTHYDMMRNVIVTGFVNINDDEEYLEGSGSTAQQAKQLVFDVSIRPEVEPLQYAELRLHVTSKNRETETDHSQETVTDRVSQSHDLSVFEVDPYFGPRLIAFKSILIAHKTWVSFNVTSAVQQWENSGLRVLEARVGLSTPEEGGGINQDFDANKMSDFVLDIDIDQGKEPLLVLFSKKSESDDQASHQIQKRDTSLRRSSQKRDTSLRRSSHTSNKNEFHYRHGNSLTSDQTFENLVNFLSTADMDSFNQFPNSTLNRSQNNQSIFSSDYSRSTTDKDKFSLYRNINNSTFLNIFKSSQKDRKNSKINKFSKAHKNSLHKTKDADIREVKNATFSSTQFSSTNRLESTSIENRKMEISKDSALFGIKKGSKSRYRRHLESLLSEPVEGIGRGRVKRSKKKRNSCQRKEMYVDFETIKWDKVIIFPRGYQAFECTGKCFTPLSEYLTPTKHAIIQTLVHTSYPEQASRACCVPSKLDPISLLYWDENGNIKYDYMHEGMVVAECGCR